MGIGLIAGLRRGGGVPCLPDGRRRRIPDMFRTMTNITGDLAGAVVVTSLEDRK
jgi:hypothetical protein